MYACFHSLFYVVDAGNTNLRVIVLFADREVEFVFTSYRASQSEEESRNYRQFVVVQHFWYHEHFRICCTIMTEQVIFVNG